MMSTCSKMERVHITAVGSGCVQDMSTSLDMENGRILPTRMIINCGGGIGRRLKVRPIVEHTKCRVGI